MQRLQSMLMCFDARNAQANTWSGQGMLRSRMRVTKGADIRLVCENRIDGLTVRTNRIMKEPSPGLNVSDEIEARWHSCAKIVELSVEQP